MLKQQTYLDSSKKNAFTVSRCKDNDFPGHNKTARQKNASKM